MSIDPISNLIVIIKNGYRTRKPRVLIPYSREKEMIIRVLKKENYLKNFRLVEKEGQKKLLARLLYKNGAPSVHEIKRVSKPGQRVYAKSRQTKPILRFKKSNQDLGTAVISTSMGIMTANEANKKNIGGELILTIY